MQRQVAILAFVMGLTFLTPGCDQRVQTEAEKANQRRERQADVNAVVSGIQYIKDTRTNFCFAYYWGGAANGGPALATVPCDAIPSELIMVRE
jgi:hypothetical protein